MHSLKKKTSGKVAYPKESKTVIDRVIESVQCNVCKIGIDVETANNMSEIERTTAKPAKTNCKFKHHATSIQCGVIDLSIDKAIYFEICVIRIEYVNKNLTDIIYSCQFCVFLC